MVKTRHGASERLFILVDYVFLTVAFLVVLFPFLNVVSQSLSDPNEVVGGRVYLWPVRPTLDAYRAVVKQSTILRGFMNSVYYALVGTALNIALTVMAAYPLSRKDFFGRNAFMVYFTITMLFGGGLVPTYLLVKSVGLIDTRWAMIVPGAMAVWHMIIARTYFQNNIPAELYESAELDGAGDLRVLLSIVLPLCRPIVAVLGLFYAVGHWNSYFDALLYLKSSRLFNLQVVLRDALSSIEALNSMVDVSTDSMRVAAFIETMKYAIIVVAIVPVLVAYPFVQRYFIKGIMIGSLKG
jgi:putative aldouronate transport system permease protein